MDNQSNATTLDDLFQGMPTGNPQPSAQPRYGDYARGFKNMRQAHRPRMIVPTLLIVAVVLLFSGVGWYVTQTLNSIPAAPMNAAQAFQAIQPFELDPNRLYTAVGQAVHFEGEWYCPIGTPHGDVIDITDWVYDMDWLTVEERQRYSIDNGGCEAWGGN